MKATKYNLFNHLILLRLTFSDIMNSQNLRQQSILKTKIKSILSQYLKHFSGYYYKAMKITFWGSSNLSNKIVTRIIQSLHYAPAGRYINA